MRIGIITQPLHSNYGGLLQNFALQQTLKRLGHQVITLDQGVNSTYKWKIWGAYIKTFIINLIRNGKKREYPKHISQKKVTYIRKHTNRFIDKYINRTKPFLHSKNFREYIIDNNVEALIVGSDQVWRPIYNPNIFYSFFNFAKGLHIKRLAYAASFGVDYWEFTEQQTEICKELIKNFNAVSVREDSGIFLCQTYLHCNPIQVLDPTMLLDKNDYIQLVQKEKEPISCGNLFTYILDDTKEKQLIINEIALELNLTPFSSMPSSKLNAKTKRSELENCVFPPVTQWIRSFMDARFVVCDSFHGAVFSIIFNKPFIIIGNKDRGISRFNSLLKIFNLENRMIDSTTKDLSIINTPIDWDKINKIRLIQKNNSINFIIENLK